MSNSLLVGPPLGPSRHPTLLCAFEAYASTDEALLTFHAAREQHAVRGRALRERAHLYAWSLRHVGVRRGDRVLLLLPTGPAFVEAFFGVMLLGAVPVPLASVTTFGNMDRYLENLLAIAIDCDAHVLVTDAAVRDRLASASALRAVLQHALTPADLPSRAQGDLPLPSIGAADTAFIQYTSGTTGQPKGAVISHRAILANTASIARGLALDAQSVGVSWLPLFHDMGLIGVLLTGIAHPYPLHLTSPDHFVLHPRGWLELLDRVRGTVTAAPNFAYELCLRRASHDVDQLDLSSVRLMLDGAEPVRPATLSRFTDAFADARLSADAMLPVYGLAEATLAVTFAHRQAPPRALLVDAEDIDRDVVKVRDVGPRTRPIASLGTPLAGMRLEVRGDDGAVRPEGQVGELCVAGPSLMDGYFRNEAASAACLQDGWLRTGDLGFVHDGELFITGRAKDLIIKSGRNIHPHDVERVAERVAGVRAGGVAAFARPNQRTGSEDLVVAVEAVGANQDERDRVAREVRGEVLAVIGAKVDAVCFCRVGGLPRTTSGKLRRRACATLFAEESAA
jgi:fatty-acyl-CoA synthase